MGDDRSSPFLGIGYDMIGDDQSPVLLYHFLSFFAVARVRGPPHDIGGVMRCSSGSFSLASKRSYGMKGEEGGGMKRGNRDRASGSGEPTELNHIW